MALKRNFRSKTKSKTKSNKMAGYGAGKPVVVKKKVKTKTNIRKQVFQLLKLKLLQKAKVIEQL